MNIWLLIFLGLVLWIFASGIWLYNGIGNKSKPGPKKWTIRWWLQGFEIILAAPIFFLIWIIGFFPRKY